MVEDGQSNAPRVVVVTRRHVRKDKWVDFVAELHLNLLVRFGALPLMIPRVKGMDSRVHQLAADIDGLLLVEGEDLSPELSAANLDVTEELRIRVAALHNSDTLVDLEKDRVESRLLQLCLERDIPVLGICRGSQMINAAYGGSLFFDVETELDGRVKHIDYNAYDQHRHSVYIVPGTPLHEWFGNSEIQVNSYHHQGVRTLGPGLQPMAYAPDGLIEGFYDPARFDIQRGSFVVGLQFHPERLVDVCQVLAGEEPVFEYPGCEKVFESFVTAAAHRAIQSATQEAHRATVGWPLGKAVPLESSGVPSEMTQKRAQLSMPRLSVLPRSDSGPGLKHPLAIRARATCVDVLFPLRSIPRSVSNSQFSPDQLAQLDRLGVSVRNHHPKTCLRGVVAEIPDGHEQHPHHPSDLLRLARFSSEDLEDVSSLELLALQSACDHLQQCMRAEYSRRHQ
mmetsp:Transcript_1921/g.3471  ORF Transcript_1921/g.3471 Transcript_1921/m.3471 type:complete len:452 (-) Transcript_1921:162-1517(-)